MEENGRKVSPYKGVWLVAFLLIIVPIIFHKGFRFSSRQMSAPANKYIISLLKSKYILH